MLHRDRMKMIIMFLNHWMAFDDSVSSWAHTGPQTGRWAWDLAWWEKTTAASTPSASGSTESHFSGVAVLFASFELSFVLRGAAAAAAWQSQ